MKHTSYQSLLKDNISVVNKALLNIENQLVYDKELDLSTNILEKSKISEKYIEVSISIQTKEINSMIEMIFSDRVALAVEYFMLMGTIEYDTSLIVTDSTVDALQEYVQMILNNTKSEIINVFGENINFKILELKSITSLIDLELEEFKYYNSYLIEHELNEIEIREEVFILYDMSSAELFRDRQDLEENITAKPDTNKLNFNADNVIIEIEDCDNNKKIYREELDNLKLLLGVELKLSVRIGKKTMLLKDIVNIDIGTTIELDQLAKEPLDILINEVKIAEGEIIVVNGKFGVQITKISTKVERLSKLRYKV